MRASEGFKETTEAAIEDKGANIEEAHASVAAHDRPRVPRLTKFSEHLDRGFHPKEEQLRRDGVERSDDDDAQSGIDVAVATTVTSCWKGLEEVRASQTK